MDRALIVKKPWIDLILSGEKTWEMRSRKTHLTGWIGLIEQGSGLIVGKAFLTGSIEIDELEFGENFSKHRINDDILLRRYSWVWEFEQAERFETPIHYKHPIGAVIWVKI